MHLKKRNWYLYLTVCLVVIASLVGIEVILRYKNIRLLGILFKDSVNVPLQARLFLIDDSTILKLNDLPTSLVVFGKNNFDSYWSVDEHGFRPDYRDTDKAGQKVLVVGDSYTYSDGASHLEAYPAKLEANLLNQGIEVNVINAAVPGYGSDQIYNKLLELVPKLRPKLVVWNLYQNDLSDANYFCLYRFNAERKLVSYPAWKNNAYRQGWLLTVAPGWLHQTKLFQSIVSVFGYAYGGDGTMPIATIGCTQRSVNQVELEMAQKTMVLIDSARTLVERYGGRLLIVNLPFHHAYGQQLPEYQPEHNRDNLLRHIPKDINVASCDAKTAFEQVAEVNSGSQQILEWFQTEAEDSSPHKHPNIKGYAVLGDVVAQCVATQLSDQLVITPACLRP